jgi:beta-glucosidase
MFFMDYKVPEDTTGLWYADIEGFYIAEADGKFEFGICVYGTAKLFVDGRLVVDNATVQRQGSAFYGSGTVEEIGAVTVKAGQKYHIKIEFASAPTNTLGTGGVVRFGGGGIRIGGAMEMDAEEEIKRAVALAAGADRVIICAGLNGDWESEGSDRRNMDLPGYHDALITAVAKANPNTVVVMQSGSPVSMPWLSQVPALIHAWYGGNETGNAIADVLFGDVNPSGKLPLTFPLRVEDNPTFLNYRSERGRTLYGEDIYIGYRYYEASKREVLFSFGHGLSYTTFQFSNVRIAVDGETRLLKVSVSIQNTGQVAGAEVAQVYISQRNPSIRRPVKELKGFTKVFLEAGEKREVHVVVEMKYAASFWDEGCGMWVMEKDMYDVLVGSSSALQRDAVTGSFEVENTTWWKGL